MLRDILAASIVLLIIVLLIIIVFSMYECPTEWNNKSYNSYIKTVKLFGEPTTSDIRPGGFASWEDMKDDSPFTNIKISDVHVKHSHPKNHCDFIYATIRHVCDAKKIRDVTSISDSIVYDKENNRMTVRCQSIGEIMATMVVADKVSKDIIHINDIGREFESSIANSDGMYSQNYTYLQILKDSHVIGMTDI